MSLATITSLRRGLQEWAQRPGNVKFLRDDQEAQLRRGLSDPARRAQAQVAGWMLGTWHLGHGMHRLLDGDAAGFDEVRQGQALRRASLLARLAAPDSKRGRRGEKVRLPFSLQHGAWTALLGLALHDPGAERLYDWLGELPDVAFSEKDSLPFFTRELLALRAGRRVNRSSRLGLYEEVLQHWSGDERLLAGPSSTRSTGTCSRRAGAARTSTTRAVGSTRSRCSRSRTSGAGSSCRHRRSTTR